MSGVALSPSNTTKCKIGTLSSWHLHSGQGGHEESTFQLMEGHSQLVSVQKMPQAEHSHTFPPRLGKLALFPPGKACVGRFDPKMPSCWWEGLPGKAVLILWDWC